MAENLELNETVKAWAEIVLDIWDDKIVKYQVMETVALANSLMHHVITSSNGNPELVQFFFNYYGKFVDMGVGKGTDLQHATFSNRTKKPWYSKPFYSQVMRLGQILADKYAHKASMAIVENVNDNALVWEKSWSRV